MKNIKSKRHLALIAGGLMSIGDPSRAEETSGLLGGLKVINESAWMKSLGLTLTGWIDAGITYNANDPADNYNGPVIFNDRAGEFQLNQLVVDLSRTVNVEGGDWDVGGKVTFMFGTDARTNTINAYGDGHWDNDLIGDDTRFYKIALPNAYIDVFAPFGNGITARLGRFYTIMGYETGLSPDNFFYSHPYTFQYGEPFTHTGAMFTYPVVSNLLVTLGAVTGGHNQFGGSLDGNAGWDGFDKNMENWNFLGGVFWNTDDKATSVGLSIITGDVNADNDLDDFRRETGIDKKDNRTFYSFIFKQNFTNHVHYVFQHDHGIEQQHPLNNFKDAQWYGIQQQLIYDVTDTVGVGLRGEWFRDDDGVRVAQMCPGCAVLASGPASYYGVTLGLNWKPLDWVAVRPEVRYDWADGIDNYDARKKSDQLLFAIDAVIKF
ncbi:porin [Methylocaldum gracile]|jgi:hypothetical protein|uniref:porin n=1 Tax=Methylocaldum sp. 0917 TaxID=2485163 RepID=UPI00105C229B